MAKPLPDWNKVAEKFDLWLPHLAPVADALLAALEAQPHHRILDVACGTGEPSFSLARALGSGARIVACDGAWGMVSATASKAARAGVNLSCLHLRAENLPFEDASFDRVVSRFGIMLFDDPAAGAREIRRVLRPGGRLALAVWDRLELMPTLQWCVDAFREHIDSDLLPATEKINRYGDPQALTELLTTLAMDDIEVTRHTLHYRFPSFDDYWDVLLRSGIMQNQLDAVNEHQQTEVRRAFERSAQPYTAGDRLAIPHGYIVIGAQK